MGKLGDAFTKEQREKVYNNAKPYVKREGTKTPGKPFERRLPNGLPIETRKYPEHVNRCTLLARSTSFDYQIPLLRVPEAIVRAAY
jgi:hypothetical protein